MDPAPDNFESIAIAICVLALAIIGVVWGFCKAWITGKEGRIHNDIPEDDN